MPWLTCPTAHADSRGATLRLVRTGLKTLPTAARVLGVLALAAWTPGCRLPGAGAPRNRPPWVCLRRPVVATEAGICLVPVYDSLREGNGGLLEVDVASGRAKLLPLPAGRVADVSSVRLAPNGQYAAIEYTPAGEPYTGAIGILRRDALELLASTHAFSIVPTMTQSYELVACMDAGPQAVFVRRRWTREPNGTLVSGRGELVALRRARGQEVVLLVGDPFPWAIWVCPVCGRVLLAWRDQVRDYGQLAAVPRPASPPSPETLAKLPAPVLGLEASHGGYWAATLMAEGDPGASSGQVWVGPFDGTEAPQPLAAPGVAHIAWSPGGQLAFDRTAEEGIEICRYDPAVAEVTVLAQPAAVASVSGLAWGADEGPVLYVLDRGGLYATGRSEPLYELK